MDIELLKTFIEVARLGHFGRAADRVFITQSAVSARIKLLEQTLGTSLLTRDRNNIQLTEAGQRLLKSAITIVNNWERVRGDLTLASEHGGPIINIGYISDLWGIFIRDWIQTNNQEVANTVFTLNSLNARTLNDALAAGELDIALVFEPPGQPNLISRELFQVSLILVSDQPLPLSKAMSNHIQIDWGSSFNTIYDEFFEDTDASSIVFNNGSQALDYLLQAGGTAYLPEAMVRPYLDAQRLFKIADAPTFNRLVYFVYRQDQAQALATEKLAESAINWWQQQNPKTAAPKKRSSRTRRPAAVN